MEVHNKEDWYGSWSAADPFVDWCFAVLSDFLGSWRDGQGSGPQPLAVVDRIGFLVTVRLYGRAVALL